MSNQCGAEPDWLDVLKQWPPKEEPDTNRRAPPGTTPKDRNLQKKWNHHFCELTLLWLWTLLPNQLNPAEMRVSTGELDATVQLLRRSAQVTLFWFSFLCVNMRRCTMPDMHSDGWSETDGPTCSRTQFPDQLICNKTALFCHYVSAQFQRPREEFGWD